MNCLPLVSIIIPVYNGANYLSEAVESALAQTYPNIEIIVVDDGSNDDGATEEIIKEYVGSLKYIKKENGGVATALNVGIREMRGEYFSWLSHDDLYLPNKISAQMELLVNLGFPNVVVYCNHYNRIEITGVSTLTKHNHCTADEFRAREVVGGNKIHGCSLLIPSKAFEEIGMFDEKLLVAQDYALWFRIAEKYDFCYLDDNLVVGRVHGAQTGVRLSEKVALENDLFRLDCLVKLADCEISAMGNGSLVKGILNLSMRMRRMGCEKSHAYLSLRLRRLVITRSVTGFDRLLASLAVGIDAGHTIMFQLVRKIRRFNLL